MQFIFNFFLLTRKLNSNVYAINVHASGISVHQANKFIYDYNIPFHVCVWDVVYVYVILYILCLWWWWCAYKEDSKPEVYKDLYHSVCVCLYEH